MIDHEARERRLMSCLGDPSRFQLVTLLLRGERCVSDLAQEIGLSQSCTTRHLQTLQRERMVRGERDGKRVVFQLRLDDPEVRSLVAWAISERAARRGATPARRPAGIRAANAREANAAIESPRPAPGPEWGEPDRPAPRRLRVQEIEDYLL